MCDSFYLLIQAEIQGTVWDKLDDTKVRQANWTILYLNAYSVSDIWSAELGRFREELLSEGRNCHTYQHSSVNSFQFSLFLAHKRQCSFPDITQE